MKKSRQLNFGSWVIPKAYLLTLTLLVLFSAGAFAQKTVTGTIRSSDDSAPMAGVTVQVKGTATGAITDDNGNYSIRVPGNDAVLVYTFIGYSFMEEVVGDRSNIDLTMNLSAVEMEEQVITALGISRDERTLGYSVTEVEGESLTQARENNVAMGLAGRVAGVNVTQAAGGPAASTRVIIRGNASLGGNNQPLYVVDGIPIDNSNLGSAGMWGGKDLGDGISSINPDDIETMTVLKGPSAAALYGTRATNGVILITTKKGKSRKGIGVEWNTNFVLEEPQVLYDFQEEYGQGAYNDALGIYQRPQNALESEETSRSSWGEKLGSGTFPTWDVGRYEGTRPIPETLPYTSNPDNMKNFYNTGQTWTNTFSFAGGSDDVNFRFSASDLRNQGLVPESGLNRNTFTLRTNAKLGEKLSIDVKLNYVREKAENRPSLSDTPENPGLNMVEMASNIPISALKPWKDLDNNYIWWNSSQFRTNPYWGVYEQTNQDQKDRFIGFGTIRYQFTPWLSAHLRAGTDYYTLRQTDIDGYGTPYVPGGRITENEWRIRETNADWLLMFNQNFSDFNVSANLGGNLLYQTNERLGLFGGNFNIPSLQTVSNGANQTVSYSISEKQINSIYGQAQLGWKNQLFLDLTARNDWSSTLPTESNSYFYPSAALSWVFTETLGINEDIFSFGKFRASYAQVGGDTDPYNLNLTYGLEGLPFLGNPAGQIAQGNIPNSLLLPSRTTSQELGLDLRFFKNRLGVDFAWYNMVTDKQIVSNTITGTTGFGAAVINTGKIQNRGIELLIYGTPVQTKSGFQWDISFNFARNRNEVLSLNPNDTTVKSIRLDESRQRNAYIEARLGQPYGAIVGTGYTRDANGNIVYGADGLPIPSANQILGVGVPDWTGGLTNTFTFKGLTFSALIDMRFGGQIHSMTNLAAYGTGKHKETLNGIAQEGDARVNGVIGKGVTETGEVNNVNVRPDVYYPNVATNIAEEFIYDADFIKMRQMTLGYSLPASLLSNSPIQGITISLVGRNLFFISKKAPNVDPESGYNSGNGQGLEYGTIPTSRTYGFNVNIKF